MQLLRRYARLIVVGVCVPLFPAVGDAQVGSAAHTVVFAITDCWGGGVDSAAVLVQPVPQGSEALRLAYPSGKELQLRTGEYIASIAAKGFFPVLSHLFVGQADSEFRTCLTLAPVEGTSQPFSNLNIRIAPNILSKREKLWVRIISPFSDLSLSSGLDKRGYCSFPPIPYGKYLVLLMQDGDIKIQKVAEIRERDAAVTMP